MVTWRFGLRFWCSRSAACGRERPLLARSVDEPLGQPAIPLGDFAINVSGSFLIGFLSVPLPVVAPLHRRLLVLVGFLGGYTTFSTFAFER